MCLLIVALGKKSNLNEIKTRLPTFSVEMQKLFVEYILKFEECLYGSIIKEIGKLAFDAAEKYSLNKDKK